MKTDITVTIHKRTLTDGSLVWDVSISTDFGMVTMSATSEASAAQIAIRMIDLNQFTVERIVVAS